MFGRWKDQKAKRDARGNAWRGFGENSQAPFTSARDVQADRRPHAKPGADVPHHYGHRQRLRERFLKAGPEALADYELLELVLFRAIPKRDVKPLAKRLLERFGSFSEVLGAEPARLLEVQGVGDATMTEIKIVHAASVKLIEDELQDRVVITSWSQLVDYVRVRLKTETREQFRVLFLDQKNQLLADEQQQQGTVNHTPVYPREVMRRALEVGATAIILVHNHPSGDPRPSKDDIAMTNKIVEAGLHMSVRVHDHLIVGRRSVYSFRSEGLMP